MPSKFYYTAGMVGALSDGGNHSATGREEPQLRASGRRSARKVVPSRS